MKRIERNRQSSGRLGALAKTAISGIASGGSEFLDVETLEVVEAAEKPSSRTASSGGNSSGVGFVGRAIEP